MGEDVEGTGRDLVWGNTEENHERLLIGTRCNSATGKKNGAWRRSYLVAHILLRLAEETLAGRDVHVRSVRDT
jgi:hypothetical protein